MDFIKAAPISQPNTCEHCGKTNCSLVLIPRIYIGLDWRYSYVICQACLEKALELIKQEKS